MVTFDAQDAQFGPLWAPRVLKMEPFGTPSGGQIVILEPAGSPFEPDVDLVILWGSFGRSFGSILASLLAHF